MLDYTAFAFDKINSDVEFLMECFREVLAELGQPELAAALPWSEGGQDQPLPPLVGQAYSVAFQLLNLVEENAAAQTRRKREQTGHVTSPSGTSRFTIENVSSRSIFTGTCCECR